MGCAQDHCLLSQLIRRSHFFGNRPKQGNSKGSKNGEKGSGHFQIVHEATAGEGASQSGPQAPAGSGNTVRSSSSQKIIRGKVCYQDHCAAGRPVSGVLFRGEDQVGVANWQDGLNLGILCILT